MAIDYQIADEELQHHINRKAANISTLSFGTVCKYEYLKVRKYHEYEYITEKKILPSFQIQILEQTRLLFLSFSKTSVE